MVAKGIVILVSADYYYETQISYQSLSFDWFNARGVPVCLAGLCTKNVKLREVN